MVCAAILRTEKLVAARLSGTEPHGVVVARHNVHLYAESRNEKVVDNVFAGHHELDVAANWNVKFVDLPVAIGLLNFPHPLLADDVDVQGILRRMAEIDIDDRT